MAETEVKIFFCSVHCLRLFQKGCCMLFSCIFLVRDVEGVKRHVFAPSATVNQEYRICLL